MLLDLARFFVDWQLLGRRLKLNDADINAIDGDHGTVEEKRVGMLKKWKAKSLKATYSILIEALLAHGKTQDAVDACKTIYTATSSEANKLEQ